MDRRLLATCVLAVVALAGCGSEADAPEPAETGARVVRVVDGDTLIARIDGADDRVRLLGVDAPESVTPDRPVECFGPQAAAEARRLLPDGARILLVADATQGRRDRFDRILAEVAREGEGVTVNEMLIAGGFAEVFRGDGRARLLPRLRAAERAARDAGLGLWGACRS